MDNYVNVTIPFSRKLETPRSITSDVELNDSQKSIYLLLKDNPKRTIKMLTEESSLSDGYVRKILKQLKDFQIIARTGSNKNGYWDVKNINL